MSFVSYAQNLEDVMLWRALKSVETGFYIDIGAWSPDLDSVTRAFYERGWRGINVEPNPFYFAKLVERRDRDVNLAVAVSEFEGEIELHVIEDTGLTSASAEIAETHRLAGWKSKSITVPALTLASVWNAHVPENQEVHFLKIDVEGLEAAVIRGADWTRHRPWIVIVEATLPNTQFEAHHEWEAVLTSGSYGFVYADGLNRYYVANEKEEIRASFRYPPNVFDGYVLDRERVAVERASALEGEVLNARSINQDLNAQIDLARVHEAEKKAEVESLWAGLGLAQSREAGLRESVARWEAEVRYIQDRSIWETLLFKTTGKPRRLLEKALFHKNGKPRGVAKRLILGHDGLPQKAFQPWMQSNDYQSLTQAVRLPGGKPELLYPDNSTASQAPHARKAKDATPDRQGPAFVPVSMESELIRKSARSAIFTVVSNNYLHFARTLLQSVLSRHPDVDVFCVIVDKNREVSSKYSGEFQIMQLEDLGIPDLQSFIFQYTVLELNTAVKPWAFERLLVAGYESVIYLDPDIYLYNPLSEVFAAFSQGEDIVVTPHLLKPINDDKRPTELDIRRAGTYNFGFCAVRQSENSRSFLRWWQGKLLRDCIVDHDRGIFVDQSWIDLVPGMFDNVCIIRNPAYNIAYWNIAQRSVEQDKDGGWTVDGEPLVFFHFSGFNPVSPEPFSKHQNRFTLANLGPAATLARTYASALIDNGAKTFSRMRYGYDAFSDGTAIPGEFRRLYLQNNDLRKLMGEDPYGRPEVLSDLARGDDVTSILPITWAMFAVYRHRPDLQSAFDLHEPDGAKRFWNWFVTGPSTGIAKELQERHRDLLSASEQTISASDRLGHAVYANLLNRSPTESERERLHKRFQTRLGASIALMQLARTPESRSRPKRSRRFKKALRSIWSGKAIEQNALPQAGPAVQIHVPQQAGTYSIAGLHAPDAEAADHGIWCTANVSVPLGNTKHHKIEILGNYFPTSLAKMNGRAALGLELQLDGRPWKRVELPESGEIALSEPVPEQLSSARVLQIKADSVFVPSAIDKVADDRELSWRLRKIRSDETMVFDSARERPLLPVTQLYRPQGFNLVGYVFAELGVGEAARTMARAASTAGIPYSLCDVGYQTENRQSDMRAAEGAVDRFFPVDMLYVNADQTQNTLQYLDRKGRPRADYRIGFWHWEQPKLPETYWSGFEGLNEVWVPTTFVQEAVSAVSPIPVFRVPHAVDFAVDPRWTRESFGIPTDKFVVLVMYDFHSYRFRKNPEAAIAAFKRAARGRRDMTLVIKTINASKYADDYAALREDVSDLDSVVFIDEVFSREQIYGLEACCDCMLSLHRAEGFGFGPAEMMFLGKPVIATGWSGNMDFMTHENSFPVNYELKPLAKPLGAYAAGLDWAEPDVEHAAACLRKIVDDSALAREIGRRAQQTMRTEFSPETIGRQYRERLTLVSMLL